MAKKEKTIEQYRKGFKRRGIFYCVVIVLLIICSIVINIKTVNYSIYKATFPKSVEMTIGGEERTVYSRFVTQNDAEYITLYYLDENNNEVPVTYGLYKNPNGGSTITSLSFESTSGIIMGIIKSVPKTLLVLFIILFVIYLLRLSYYLSNKDEEWRNKASDKMTGIRIKLDKFFTKIDEKIKKIGKKN